MKIKTGKKTMVDDIIIKKHQKRTAPASQNWPYLHSSCAFLTHWGRATHIWVGKLTIIGSDNGLSPGRRQAIIWTNAGILFIGPLGTNFSEILLKIHIHSHFIQENAFENVVWKMSAILSRP